MRQSRTKGSRSSVAQSRATAQGAGDRDRIVVIVDGKDVTPKPMMSLKPTVLKGGQLLSGSANSDSQSDMSELAVMERLSSTGFSQSLFSDSASETPKSEAAEAADRADMSAEQEQVASSEGSAKAKPPNLSELFDYHETLTEKDLNAEVFITLSETETIWMFERPSVSVSMESADARYVQDDNERYKKTLKDHESSDRFVESEMQTLNLMQKQKEVQSTPLACHTRETQANHWAIHDALQELEDGSEDQDDVAPTATVSSDQLAAMAGHAQGMGRGRAAAAPATSHSGSQTYSRMASTLKESDTTSAVTAGPTESTNYDTSTGAAEPRMQGDVLPQEEADPLESLNRVELVRTLQLADSVLAQNSYLDKLLLYRNVKPLEVLRASELEKQESAEAEEDMAEDSGALSSNVPSGADGAEAPAAQESSSGQSFGGSAATAQDAGEPAATESSTKDGAEPAEPSESGEDTHDSSAIRLSLLWEFRCDLTEGRNVSCLGWNKVKKDLLAVGYGQFEFGKQIGGLVAFWSLKNPDYPLWHFSTSCGVTALDFSTKNGNILAIGLYDGTVAIYDVMTRQQNAAMESTHSSGKHSDPVWKMRWIEQVPDMDKLITISTDGRVTMWSITKGLEHSNLMKLKRVVARQPAAAQGPVSTNMNTEAFISRRASGMSFSFCVHDPRVYIAGTEDGPIHKCSTSYSEQYLETYTGHKGPVYNLQWSPFRSELFLSCSADWTVRLWTEHKDSSLLTFQSASEQVNDVQWCPSNSTVFATVTNGGVLEIWDITLSTMKPVAAKSPAGQSRQNCVLFSDISPVVVCGGANGAVAVYRLFNCNCDDETAEDQKQRLDEAIAANIVKTVPTI